MGTSQPALAPSPALIFDTFNAYQKTAALKAAIELGLFTAIGEGNATVQDIAQRVEATERGTRILCDYLVVGGFLTKQDGRYALTPDSALFLDHRSPAYMGDAARFLCMPEMIASYNTNLAGVIRNGGSVLGPGGSVVPENPIWVEFAHSMVGLIRMQAELIAERMGATQGEPCKVLDIAAGHGLFGISIARRNQNAHVVALDWPNVLEVAKGNARKAGVEGRFSTIEGSAFEMDLGSDYDLVLITNFLHHFAPGTCEGFLRKVHAALKPGCRAVTLDFVPNEDRISPLPAATFSMIMLGTTPHGDAYTFAEFDRMFRQAGFARSELHEMPPTPERMIVSYKDS
ncbi:MAG: class I SAM-dependent methyltransferase [Terriglobia bacterium]